MGFVLYVSKFLVDMEKLVGFYFYFFIKNWFLFVIDSFKLIFVNLFGNDFI